MEENAFDPVRAIASLSPSSLLCPSGALRVLGSGFIGIVFLEEDPRLARAINICRVGPDESRSKAQYYRWCAYYVN